MASAPTDLADLATRGLVARAASGTAARDRTVPLLPVFGHLLPGAVVQRGSVVACHGAAALSIALAVAAGPSQQGAWVAVVGLPGLGLAAAAEAGVVLHRLVAVADPEAAAAPRADSVWADLLAACIDGFDLVVLGPSTQQVRPATARRLVARLQARGALLLTVGAPVFGADLRFDTDTVAWAGLGQGYGVAQGRQVHVSLSGRRVPQARRVDWWLPTVDGAIEPVEPVDHNDHDEHEERSTVVVPLRRTG